jgi:hypothetical protein
MVDQHLVTDPEQPAVAPTTSGVPAPNEFDQRTAEFLRAYSQVLSRRGLIARAGKVILGVLGVSLAAALPVDPFISEAAAAYNCTSWQLCGICGRICTCCNGGGGLNVCPAGTTFSAYWSACCVNPSTGFSVRFFYWDCVGGSANCGSCLWCNNGNCPQPLWGSGTYKCTAVTNNPSC